MYFCLTPHTSIVMLECSSINLKCDAYIISNYRLKVTPALDVDLVNLAPQNHDLLATG